MKTILIIEDDADNRRLFQEILRANGYAVSLAATMPAVRYVARLQPALVLLNHRMGYELGTDLCRQLKADPDTKHIPVILISADNDIERLAEQARADAFLAKPFDIRDLVWVVVQTLSAQ